MRILEVSRYKNNFADHQLPFVTEQGEALRQAGNSVDYHLLRGNYLSAVRALRRKIRDMQPDMVHAHYGLSGITAVLAVRCGLNTHRPSLIITFHNGETLNRLVNALSSFFSLFADHVIYVARHIRDLCYFKAKHYTILPCGVNLDDCVLTPRDEARRLLGWANDTRYILFGGAFSNKRKNVTLLRDALSLLHRDDVQVIEMSGLTRSECVLRMCACDFFALPTHSEGSPQALKEAMACNCPIIATDVADIAHLLGDMPGHFILRNPRPTKERWEADEHSVEEMAALVQQALAYNARTEGRARIQSLGLTNPQIADRLTEIYTSTLNSPKLNHND